ncbi:unnamed protein product [Rodentolepis nana]|uniref:Secreted protein n=1 Tax=Rodentolepis nana TaxID=102285 RepID=A0A0R3TGH6_RODNA|nr:unnamed protein product [Rodentolepis nana]
MGGGCLLASQYLWLLSLSLELDTESGGSALSLELDTESGGSSPFPPLDTESGGSSPFPPLNTESGGSSPFPPVYQYLWLSVLVFRAGYDQMGLLHFLIFNFVAFSFVRALSSLHLDCILPIFEGVLPGNPSSGRRVPLSTVSPFFEVRLSNGFDSWPVGRRVPLSTVERLRFLASRLYRRVPTVLLCSSFKFVAP